VQFSPEQPDGISLVVDDNGPGFPAGLEPQQTLISFKDDS
jgi:signal transduction histidine kinase